MMNETFDIVHAVVLLKEHVISMAEFELVNVNLKLVKHKMRVGYWGDHFRLV